MQNAVDSMSVLRLQRPLYVCFTQLALVRFAVRHLESLTQSEFSIRLHRVCDAILSIRFPPVLSPDQPLPATMIEAKLVTVPLGEVVRVSEVGVFEVGIARRRLRFTGNAIANLLQLLRGSASSLNRGVQPRVELSEPWLRITLQGDNAQAVSSLPEVRATVRHPVN